MTSGPTRRYSNSVSWRMPPFQLREPSAILMPAGFTPPFGIWLSKPEALNDHGSPLLNLK